MERMEDEQLAKRGVAEKLEGGRRRGRPENVMGRLS